jgi:hypothetical protein
LPQWFNKALLERSFPIASASTIVGNGDEDAETTENVFTYLCQQGSAAEEPVPLVGKQSVYNAECVECS